MAYVITRACCNDGVCVDVCPVNCIHPAPGTVEYETTEQLYIDPSTCIECDACFEACPVDAIYGDVELPPELTPYRAINAAYFAAP